MPSRNRWCGNSVRGCRTTSDPNCVFSLPWPVQLNRVEYGMPIPHRVVKAPQELLAFLPEREHPAVPFEQGDDVRIVARRQRRSKLHHQRRRDQSRSTEARPQGLLRGRQLVQKGVVLNQGDDDGFVAVETFAKRRRYTVPSRPSGPPIDAPLCAPRNRRTFPDRRSSGPGSGGLRCNPNRLPCSWLVPPLVTMLIAP